MTADGAYDGNPTYQSIAEHSDDIAVVIPPRSTAVPSGKLDAPTQQDRHLTMIADHGRLARLSARQRTCDIDAKVVEQRYRIQV